MRCIVCDEESPISINSSAIDRLLEMTPQKPIFILCPTCLNKVGYYRGHDGHDCTHCGDCAG